MIYRIASSFCRRGFNEMPSEVAASRTVCPNPMEFAWLPLRMKKKMEYV